MFNAELHPPLAIGLLLGAVGAIVSPPVSPLPLEKGTQWTYEGKVEWTAVNSAKVLWTNVHWVMEVVDVKEGGEVRASVIRGLPDELAWYEPGRTPGYAVLVSVTNHVYRISADSEQDGKNLARHLTSETFKLPPSAEEWLDFPLAKGKQWGRNAEREDHYYRWFVQGKRAKNLRVAGYPTNHPADVWTITYRTNPDHQVLDIVAGLGVTRYEYVHRGTVASADVRLVSFRKPGKGNQKPTGARGSGE